MWIKYSLIVIVIYSSLSRAMDQPYPLHDAVEQGKHDQLRTLLRFKASLPILDSLDQSPLHYAARRADVTALTILLDHGFAVNQPSKDGWTPAFWAVYKGSAPALARLEHAGAILDHRSQRGATLMHLALQEGHIHLIPYLLGKGVLLRQADNARLEPIDYALKTDNKSAVEYAFLRPEYEKDRGQKWLDMIVGARYHKAWQTYTWLPTLHLEQKAQAELEILPHSSINSSKWIPKLVFAGYPRLATFLLARGADPNVQSSGQCMSALMFAAVHGDLESAQCLIGARAAVNMVDKDGLTALHYAAGEGHSTVVRFLLGSGANAVAQTTHVGLTPLHSAVREGRIDVMRILHTYNRARLEHKDFNGKTPMHHAVLCSCPALVELIVAGARVDSEDDEGQTPLMYAAKTGKLQELVGLLRLGNASCYQTDNKGFTALDYAITNSRSAFLFLLYWLRRQGVNAEDLHDLVYNLPSVQHALAASYILDDETPIILPTRAGRIILNTLDLVGSLDQRLVEIKNIYNYYQAQALLSQPSSTLNVYKRLGKREIKGNTHS